MTTSPNGEHTLMDSAIAYATHNWRIFPCRPRGKEPLTGHGFLDASSDVNQVRRWWTETPAANIGFVPGSARLLVVDVDGETGEKEAQALGLFSEPTLQVETSGGVHLYFAAPPEDVKEGVRQLGNGLDVRGQRGYVILPPSVHESGAVYQFSDVRAVPLPLPPRALERLRNGAKAAARTSPVAGEVISEGARNATLTSLAGTMRRRGMTTAEIRTALLEVNGNRCHPPLDDREVCRIASSVGRYSPAENTEQQQDEREAGRRDLTHDGLALALGDQWPDARHVAAWGQWLFYDGSVWRTDESLEHFTRARRFLRQKADELDEQAAAQVDVKLQKAMRAQAKQLRGAYTVAQVVGLTRSNLAQAAVVAQWDRDVMLAATPTVTVQLTTGECREARLEDYLTRQTAVAPAPPGTATPGWQTFLTRVTRDDGELQNYLQRMAGYCLTGDVRDHVLFFLYGTGANGKTVFERTLLGIWQDYGVTIGTDMLLLSRGEHHPTELARLRGARLAAGGEVELGRTWDAAKLKALTGGDRLAARFMRQDFFEFDPQFKLMLVGNTKPSLRGVDEAIRRRLHLIPFTVTIPPAERDPELATKLQAEWPGILRWAMDGCLAWQREGLNPPAAVTSATESYLEGEDSVGQWLDECAERDPQAHSQATELYGSWKQWCEQRGEYVGTQKRFANTLQDRGFTRQRAHGGTVYVGLRVRSALVGGGVRR